MLEQNQAENTPKQSQQKTLYKFVPKTADDVEEQQINKKIQNAPKVPKRAEYKTQRWTLQQNKQYIKFLEEHAHLFRYKSVRRVRQVFILLSDRMSGKRTPAQCKSHHQKMRKATEKGTIKEIIRYMKRKLISNKRRPRLNKSTENDNEYQQERQNEDKPLFTILPQIRYHKFQIAVRIQMEALRVW